MRICFFAHAHSIHVRRWANYLIEKGYEIHLITPTAPGAKDCRIEGATVYNIPYFHSLNTIMLSLGYIKWLLHKIKPDILHGIFLTNCAFYASLTRFHPFVATVLGSDILIAPQRSSRRRGQVKYTLKNADIVTVDADVLKERLMEIDYPESKIIKILFGVDLSLLSTKKKRGGSLILSCRNLNPIYNVDIIIKAYRLVRKAIPSARLTVVGEISNNPKLLCNDTNIEFRPAMPHNEIIDYMLNFEIFVSVPSSDASSVSLLEAMAIGLFPIVSNIPANREWIKDGYNGMLVPPRDSHALADRIIEALRESSLRESAARINKKIVREQAIFKDNMQKLEHVYHTLAT